MQKPPPYPRRPELDAANAAFRHRLSRLGREAMRHQGEEREALAAEVVRIVSAGIDALNALAQEANAAESGSPRNRALLERHQQTIARKSAVLTERFAARRAALGMGPRDDGDAA